MDWHRIQILTIYLIFRIVVTTSTELGSSCSRDRDCKVGNSHCVSGVCDCKHYYARFNSTACLESKLLGQECLIHEQCSLRVANSICKDEFCHCNEGFIKFRKHTCLGPAKPGSVCYSDEHCQMWSKSTYCKFIITNLFGKCECSDEGNCEQKETTTMNPVDENSTTVVNEETDITETETENDGNMEKENDYENENSWTDENTVPPFADPFSYQKQHLQETQQTEEDENDAVTEEDENDGVTEEDENDGVTEDEENQQMSEENVMELNSVTENEVEVTEETFNNVEGNEFNENSRVATINGSTATLNESKYRIETDDNEHHDQWQNIKPISLGFPCKFDSQCQREDSESKCIDGVCDCVEKDNRTSCGRHNTGCPPETFQCRSSGTCVSWFFVCDGQPDCPDGSDEDCNGPVCPRSAFQCGINGNCVSLSVICDGVKNCPGGEDEERCLPENRKADEGCPKDTFQCANGRCLPKYEFCNAIPKCADGSDESSPMCRSQAYHRYLGFTRTRMIDRYCPFRCANGRCRSTAIVCSGRDGCGDNSDEAQCSVCRCPKINTSNKD